jgi:hypothetical protein
MQRRWNVWLHSDVTVACPRPIAPWQTQHEDDCGGGVGALPSQKGFCVAGGAFDPNRFRLPPLGSGVDVPANMEVGLGIGSSGCPNGPALGCAGEPKENGDSGDRAGTVTGVSLHFAVQTGQAEVPETQRRWKVWAHSDVNEACRRPMSPLQAPHELLAALFAMMLANFFASDFDLKKYASPRCVFIGPGTCGRVKLAQIATASGFLRFT